VVPERRPSAGARAFATRGQKLAASGDIDHDGTDDLIWQFSDGTVNFWTMRAGVIFETAQTLMQGSSVVAKGTFEGAPGEQDLIWREAATDALAEFSFGAHPSDFLIV
jgi:hypothetical protein